MIVNGVLRAEEQFVVNDACRPFLAPTYITSTAPVEPIIGRVVACCFQVLQRHAVLGTIEVAVDDKAHMVPAKTVRPKAPLIIEKEAVESSRLVHDFPGTPPRLETVQLGAGRTDVEPVADVSFKKTEEFDALFLVQVGELADHVVVDEDSAERFACSKQSCERCRREIFANCKL